METISKLTSKHKYLHNCSVQNCSILSELKWELLDVLKCQNIRFIIFFQLVLCQVGSANFLLFLWTFQFLQMPFKTIILQILLRKMQMINKHLFSFQLEPVALFQIRSEAEQQVCVTMSGEYQCHCMTLVMKLSLLQPQSQLPHPQCVTVLYQ